LKAAYLHRRCEAVRSTGSLSPATSERLIGACRHSKRTFDVASLRYLIITKISLRMSCTFCKQPTNFQLFQAALRTNCCSLQTLSSHRLRKPLRTSSARTMGEITHPTIKGKSPLANAFNLQHTPNCLHNQQSPQDSTNIPQMAGSARSPTCGPARP